MRKEYDVRATLISPISARRRLTRHIPKSSLPQPHEPPATPTEFAYLECSFGLAVKNSMGVIPIGVSANATGALYAPKPSPTLALNDIQPVKFGLDVANPFELAKKCPRILIFLPPCKPQRQHALNCGAPSYPCKPCGQKAPSARRPTVGVGPPPTFEDDGG